MDVMYTVQRPNDRTSYSGAVGEDVRGDVGLCDGGSVGGTVGVLELNADLVVGTNVGNAVGVVVGSLQRHLSDGEQAPVFVPSTFIWSPLQLM